VGRSMRWDAAVTPGARRLHLEYLAESHTILKDPLRTLARYRQPAPDPNSTAGEKSLKSCIYTQAQRAQPVCSTQESAHLHRRRNAEEQHVRPLAATPKHTKGAKQQKPNKKAKKGGMLRRAFLAFYGELSASTLTPSAAAEICWLQPQHGCATGERSPVADVGCPP
jgi:hypothetical protein